MGNQKNYFQSKTLPVSSITYFRRACSNVYQEYLYNQAKKITAEKQSFYETLQAKYNTSEDVSCSKITFLMQLIN